MTMLCFALGRCKPPAVAGPAAPEERPDAWRAVPGARHDPASGREASGGSREGQSGLLEAAGPGKAALHQSRADQPDRRTWPLAARDTLDGLGFALADFAARQS